MIAAAPQQGLDAQSGDVSSEAGEKGGAIGDGLKVILGDAMTLSGQGVELVFVQSREAVVGDDPVPGDAGLCKEVDPQVAVEDIESPLFEGVETECPPL